MPRICLGINQHHAVPPTPLPAGASKLTYPAAEQGKSEEPDMASHPSSAVWGQWGSTD